jgi:hypothetical protein
MREHFDSRAAAAASTTLNCTRPKLRPPLPSPEVLAAQRREAIRDGAVYVTGKQGTTVFKPNLVCQAYRPWDGMYKTSDTSK